MCHIWNRYENIDNSYSPTKCDQLGPLTVCVCVCFYVSSMNSLQYSHQSCLFFVWEDWGRAELPFGPKRCDWLCGGGGGVWPIVLTERPQNLACTSAHSHIWSMRLRGNKNYSTAASATTTAIITFEIPLLMKRLFTPIQQNDRFVRCTHTHTHTHILNWESGVFLHNSQL